MPVHVIPSPPPASDFKLLSVIAVRENVLRAEFSHAVYYDGILSALDASDPTRYAIVPVDGTKGLDDSPVRPVSIVEIRETDTSDEVIFSPGSKGRFLDIVVDRPFTAFPAQYTATVWNLWTFDLFGGFIIPPIELDGVTGYGRNFYGNSRLIVQPMSDSSLVRRDIANPSTLLALTDSTIEPNPLLLGTFSYDEGGDYVADDGDISLMKRIYRRLFTRPGAFTHLGLSYGLGLGDMGKKLLLAGTRQRIEGEATRQVLREPEVVKAAVTIRHDSKTPSLARLLVALQTRAGRKFKYDSPFRTFGATP